MHTCKKLHSSCHFLLVIIIPKTFFTKKSKIYPNGQSFHMTMDMLGSAWKSNCLQPCRTYAPIICKNWSPIRSLLSSCTEGITLGGNVLTSVLHHFTSEFWADCSYVIRPFKFCISEHWTILCRTHRNNLNKNINILMRCFGAAYKCADSQKLNVLDTLLREHFTNKIWKL